MSDVRGDGVWRSAADRAADLERALAAARTERKALEEKLEDEQRSRERVAENLGGHNKKLEEENAQLLASLERTSGEVQVLRAEADQLRIALEAKNVALGQLYDESLRESGELRATLQRVQEYVEYHEQHRYPMKARKLLAILGPPATTPASAAEHPRSTGYESRPAEEETNAD